MFPSGSLQGLDWIGAASRKGPAALPWAAVVRDTSYKGPVSIGPPPADLMRVDARRRDASSSCIGLASKGNGHNVHTFFDNYADISTYQRVNKINKANHIIVH